MACFLLFINLLFVLSSCCFIATIGPESSCYWALDWRIGRKPFISFKQIECSTVSKSVFLGFDCSYRGLAEHVLPDLGHPVGKMCRCQLLLELYILKPISFLSVSFGSSELACFIKDKYLGLHPHYTAS